MKRMLLIMVTCALMTTVRAQVTMRDVWQSMPDHLLPFLHQNLRTELLELHDMKVKAEVKNLLSGTSVMDTLTTDYTFLHLSEYSTLSLKLLTRSDSTQLICFVKTVMAPEAESEVRFFDVNWQSLDIPSGLPLHESAEALLSRMTVKPADMEEGRFEELRKMIDPVMCHVMLSPVASTLVMQLSIPALTRQERDDIQPIIKQISFKWDGQTFKEY
ncbi:MAG: DUF3256 family protein [Prevotella sp.]|nr:DUF3256 family protein [Prevotella sp.]